MKLVGDWIQGYSRAVTNVATEILDARSRRLVATAGAGYLGYFSTGIAALINIPVARQHLSSELFGVWMMLSGILSFMAFADLGIANVVLNRITQAQAAGNRLEFQKILATGYTCTLGLGAILFLAWKAWSIFATDPTSIAGVLSAVDRPKVKDALDVFILILAISIPSSLIQKIQLGMQQGYWNGIAQGCGSLLSLIGVPLIFHYGGGLTQLIIATVGVQVGINMINTIVWLYRNRLLVVATWRCRIDFWGMRCLISSGIYFFLLQLSASLAFQSDAIVVTQVHGHAVYGEFATVQKLFLVVSALLNATILGLWPAFGDAIARKDMMWVKRGLWRALILVVVLAILMVAVILLAMPWIVKYWMHFVASPPLGLLVLLSAWTVVDAIGCVLASFMNGAGILRQQVGVSVVMASAAIAGKWILVPAYGPAGAVLATFLAYCLISLPSQAYILKRALSPRGMNS